MIKDYAVFIQHFLYPFIDRVMEAIAYAEKRGLQIDRKLIFAGLWTQAICVFLKCLTQVVVVSIVVLGTIKLCRI